MRNPWRCDAPPALLCALAGVVLCTLPHWLWVPRLGEPVWVADQDELYYLGVASRSYFDHPFRLGDPVVEGGHGLYQGLPLLPGVWVARLLGLGPASVSLVWRVWGGFWAGLGWYGVAGVHGARPWV
ncbi:MAG: hypothetical protein LC745_02685, partial [Planctomycetia bacterium]|nr:hypothetical protein [Planctomycetia bacterium]